MARSGETLNDTRARLGVEEEAAARPRRRWVTPVIAIGVTVLVTIVVFVIIAVGSRGGDGGGGGLFSNPWSGYPGTRYTDAREILASPSQEESVADVEGFVAAFKARIAERYEVVWVVPYSYSEAELSPADNGYDGESMLTTYRGAEWNGAIVTDDPDVREYALEVFTELSEEFGLTDISLDNELYDGDEDEAYTIERFGGLVRSEQVLWSARAYNYDLRLPDFSMDVYDASMPAPDTFDGWRGMTRAELPGGDATVFVSVQGRAYDLLAEADRDEFIERLRAYDENDKP